MIWGATPARTTDASPEIRMVDTTEENLVNIILRRKREWVVMKWLQKLPRLSFIVLE